MKYDITGTIGPMFSTDEPAQWPMYSYERPGYMLWNAIYNRLRERNWTEEQAKEWLQSKGPRWALDDKLGEAIERIGIEYADTMGKP